MNNTEYRKKLALFSEINLVGPLITKQGLELINPNNPIIFVDGGAKAYEKVSSPLKLKVGDQDSSDEVMDILLKPDKDFTDFEYSLTLLPQSIQKINLIGFLGGRKDHEFTNLGVIHHFLKNNSNVLKVVWNNELITLNKGSSSFSHSSNFSIIFLEESQLKITGHCKYKIQESTLLKPLTGRTVSNLGSGTINLETNNPIFIFLN